MRLVARGSMVIACGMAFACGNTIDYLGLEANSEGIDTLPQGSSEAGTSAPMSSSSSGSESSATTSSSTSGSGTSSDGSGSSTTSACGDPCAKLDMLVVLDNTEPNEAVRSGLVMNTEALAQVITAPGRRWLDDFHVGIVPTNSGGTLAQCRVTGALSATPRSGQPIPCVSSSGANWADQDDAALALLLQCFANLEPVGNPARPIALAAARGLEVAVPADAMGDEVIAACNDGFVRSDSLKVVAIIAADDDPGGGIGSPGTPSDWAGWIDLVDPDPCSPTVVVAVVPSNPLTCAPVADNVASWAAMVDVGATSDWCQFRSSQGASGLQDLATILDEVCG